MKMQVSPVKDIHFLFEPQVRVRVREVKLDHGIQWTSGHGYHEDENIKTKIDENN